MSNSETVVFSGVGGRLSIKAFKYERPDANDSFDANWVDTEVGVEAGPFSGSFKAAFGTHDFADLRDRLQTAVGLLSGELQFESTEGDLVLGISFSTRGSATVRVTARPNSSPGAKVEFTIESDQSFLSEAARQLTALVTRFPVRTGKE